MSTRLSLFNAMENNDLLTVNSLIQSGTCDVNVENSDGNTLIHIAVQEGKTEIVRSLLNRTDCDVNIKTQFNDAPLHIAVLNSNIEIVRCLLERNNCDVNVQNSDSDTPLHIAVSTGNIEIVRFLVKLTDCDINVHNSDGNIVLHIAVVYNYIDIVCLLLNKAKCNVNKQNNDGNTPLHAAVWNGNIEIIRYFLNRDECHVDIKNNAGETLLHIAVLNGNIEIVRCLIEFTDCDVNIQDNDDNTPFHIAVQKGNIEMLRYLLERQECNVNIQNSAGNTPLYTAVSTGNIEIVRFLGENTSCDVNIPNSASNTPLHTAVWNDNIEIIRCLIEQAECNVDIQNHAGETPLHLAVKKGNIHSVRCLIEQAECNVNIHNLAGDSPFSTTAGLQILHEIAKYHNVEFIHFLIQHNVDVLTDHVDNQLQFVKLILTENDFPSLSFFIRNGLYINSLTSSGENIVHLLAHFNMDYLYIDFNFLFDYGLDFDLINNDGNSPLMVASLLNYSPFIQFLASLPCDVNIQNHQGHTALHLCVIGFTSIKKNLNMTKVNSVVKRLCAHEYYPRYLACIDTLLSLGADVNIQDNNGKTVLMLVCMKNDSKLLKRLLIHGADVNIADRSALQYIDLTNNVFDLACFNLLLSHGCRQFFNQPCLNGNTIIQNILQFTPLWQIDDTVKFIKYLVFNNVNQKHFTSDDGEISYGQISLEEFSSESRQELRQILYLSGGSFVQITQFLNFDHEEHFEASLPVTLREKPREKFYLFANNLSLKDICRRVIRQNTGLAIHDRILELFEFPFLADFLMFKDIDSERFSLPVQLESFINDDYDDDYNSYDLNEDDDYENDYLVYEDCTYFNLEKYDGFTPLHRAVKERNRERVKLLLEHSDRDVNTQDIDGCTPLHIAVLRNDIEIVRCMTEQSYCNKQDSVCNTSLHIATGQGNKEIARCVIQHITCDVNIQDSNGNAPLHIAVHKGNIEIVRCLTEHSNCDVNTQDSNGNTPLHIAVQRDNIEIVRYLIAHSGCNVNKMSQVGNAPLHIAVRGGNIEIVKYLIEHTNCSVNIQDIAVYSYTPLHIAVRGGNIEIVRYLIEHTTCNVNKKDHFGDTPLHIAVRFNSIEMVRCILSRTECDVNTPDSTCTIPLHSPVQGGNIEIVRCLMEHTSCHVDIEDSYRYTDIALEMGYTEILKCILQHAIKFPPLWQIDDTVQFIKFLVFKNVNLQNLTSNNREMYYGRLSLEEFSSESRHELRKLLYLSGGSFIQITHILDFEVEENYEASLPITVREKPREKFYLFANNLSLQDMCNRFIRQNTGLKAIHDLMSEHLAFPPPTNCLSFLEEYSKRFPLPVPLMSFMDDYDVSNCYENFYSFCQNYLVYTYCKYLYEVYACLKIVNAVTEI